MVFEFLTTVYLGNTLITWIWFLVIIGIFIIAGKIIEQGINILNKKVIVKSKSNIDDKIIGVIKKPVNAIIILLGIYVAYLTLSVTPEIDKFVINGINLGGIAIATWMLVRISDTIIELILHPVIGKTKTQYDNQIIQLLSKVIKILIISLAAIITLDNFGIDVVTLIAGLGVGGIAIAFAAKETIGDMFGGISLLMSKPFIVGDFIEFDGTMGTVEELSLRRTKIRNLDKREVSVPNSKLSNTIITNITSAPKRKVVWKLGVTYNTSTTKINKAKKIIKEKIEKCKYCEKKPIIYFDEFGESSLKLLVVFYTKSGEWGDMMKAKDEVGINIKKEFEKNKIEFAFPTQTIYLEKNK